MLFYHHFLCRFHCPVWPAGEQLDLGDSFWMRHKIVVMCFCVLKMLWFRCLFAQWTTGASSTKNIHFWHFAAVFVQKMRLMTKNGIRLQRNFVSKNPNRAQYVLLLLSYILGEMDDPNYNKPITTFFVLFRSWLNDKAVLLHEGQDNAINMKDDYKTALACLRHVIIHICKIKVLKLFCWVIDILTPSDISKESLTFLCHDFVYWHVCPRKYIERRMVLLPYTFWESPNHIMVVTNISRSPCIIQ